jgi:hypothetical protein
VSGPTTNYQHIIPTKPTILLDDVLAQGEAQRRRQLHLRLRRDPIPMNYGVPINDTTKFTTASSRARSTPARTLISMTFSKDYWTKGKLTPDANSALTTSA